MTSEELRLAVAEKYGQVAIHPEGTHPFPVGYAFAENLGYPSEILDNLPPDTVSAFAGISYPLPFADLKAGERVLDLGCGAGMDTILMAREVGPNGIVHSLDLSKEMIKAAKKNVANAGLSNIKFHNAPAEAIPLENESVDVVVVNGIFNLCPKKEIVMQEAYRVLRSGGRMLASEIVLDDSAEIVEGATCDLGGDALSGLSIEKWFQ